MASRLSRAQIEDGILRKLLLITTALVGFVAVPMDARADPVSAVIAAGIGFTAGTTAFAIATSVITLAGSMLLNYAAQALLGKKSGKLSAPDQRQELQQPTALPAYRYVYGYTWAPGTPVGWVVRGNILYICYLLNSRPSALPTHKVIFDERDVEAAGDPFDFAGGGASAANAPFAGNCQYWIGRGDQTTCPAQIVSDSDYFAATDAWLGRTVLWARLDCGKSDDRSQRWPATPPALNVEGLWSIEEDPRNGVSVASRNAALIVLDALRTNPIRPYGDAYLWLDSFKEAIERCEDAFPNKDGTTRARFNSDGVLVWSDGSELEDQLDPLLAAGGLRLVRVGGKLGIIPAVTRNSVYTITDFTEGQSIEMTRWQSSDDIYTECVASYTAPDRAYESAEAPAYIVPGAQAADGGVSKRLDLQLDFVTDHRQAQYLAKIAAMRSRMQRVIAGEMFPDAFRLVAGSRATVSLPSPYTAWNGEYEVESATPGAGINDDDSITLRLPVTVRETSGAIYAWDPATEEQDVEATSFNPVIPGVQPPATVTLATGGAAALVSAGATVARVEVSWPASASASADGYNWQFRSFDGSAWSEWQTGGYLGNSAERRVYISPAVVDVIYQARIQTVGFYGASEWRESGTITASGPEATVAAPEILLAVGGSGEIDLTIRQANDGGAISIEVWGSDTGSVSAAELLVTLAAGANVTVAWAEDDLGNAKTRHYWARARDVFGNASGYSARATATTSA
ncbi:hypothetical protein D2T31_05010 [Sinirhodobacter populi]|uniref:Tip attachment protein J domain-containing protein n=1 Tax=Paenirhodobacter populi TaxID=2306993 RepID=A0A443KET7_9RHOB|nr:phage tail protein [Sinirhodobacter populi]RWR31361.1 hypothetical protein D2T31_05010 [Sinirhodobacter populi]